MTEFAELAERFVDLILISDDECFYWMGPTNQKGYGVFNANGRRHSAHRFAYFFFVGEIPVGLELDHLCRHRDCVNPAHLEAVTHRVNILRSEAPPARNARATHCSKGHAFAGANLRIHASGRRVCVTCDQARKGLWRDRQDPAALRTYNAHSKRRSRSRRASA